MFERLNNPQEAHHYLLGAALKMENKVLEMLGKNVEEAQDEQVKELFSHHQDETRQQIANLEQAFAAFDWEVDDSPGPGIEGIDKEAKANVKKTDDALVDSIILKGAVATEHYEIAMYENLIIDGRAMGKDDVVQLYQQNLEQEQHTLEEVKRMQESVAAVTPKAA